MMQQLWANINACRPFYTPTSNQHQNQPVLSGPSQPHRDGRYYTVAPYPTIFFTWNIRDDLKESSQWHPDGRIWGTPLGRTTHSLALSRESQGSSQTSSPVLPLPSMAVTASGPLTPYNCCTGWTNNWGDGPAAAINIAVLDDGRNCPGACNINPA